MRSSSAAVAASAVTASSSSASCSSVVLRAGRAQLELDREQPLLGAVVQVPLQAAALPLGRRDDARARGAQLLHQLGVLEQHQRRRPESLRQPSSSRRATDRGGALRPCAPAAPDPRDPGLPVRRQVERRTPCTSTQAPLPGSRSASVSPGSPRASRSSSSTRGGVTGPVPTRSTRLPRLAAAKLRPRTCPTSTARGIASALAMPSARKTPTPSTSSSLRAVKSAVVHGHDGDADEQGGDQSPLEPDGGARLREKDEREREQTQRGDRVDGERERIRHRLGSAGEPERVLGARVAARDQRAAGGQRLHDEYRDRPGDRAGDREQQDEPPLDVRPQPVVGEAQEHVRDRRRPARRA